MGKLRIFYFEFDGEGDALNNAMDEIGRRFPDRTAYDSMFLSVAEIAKAVGVSPQAVRKASQKWNGKRQSSRGKYYEFPVSEMPQHYQAPCLAFWRDTHSSDDGWDEGDLTG